MCPRVGGHFIVVLYTRVPGFFILDLSPGTNFITNAYTKRVCVCVCVCVCVTHLYGMTTDM